MNHIYLSIKVMTTEKILTTLDCIYRHTSSFTDVSKTNPFAQQTKHIFILSSKVLITFAVSGLASYLTSIGTEVVITARHSFFDGSTFHTCDFSQQSNHELTHRIHLAIRCKSLYIIVHYIQRDLCLIKHINSS